MSETTSHLPTHIGFIMDGNGRWAERQGKPRLEGHRQGVETVKRVCDWLISHEIPYATFYAFSTENWKRPQEEVSGLFNLMRLYFRQDMKELQKKNIRVRFIGDRSEGRMSADILSLMEEVEAKTAGGTALTIQFAINYSGRDELLRATRKLVAQAVEEGIVPEMIEDTLSAALDSAGVPDPDLIIRTSGEQRVSNFMLWQMAYSEFYFSNATWPDFGPTHLQAALSSFGGRQRRFGALLKARAANA